MPSLSRNDSVIPVKTGIQAPQGLANEVCAQHNNNTKILQPTRNPHAHGPTIPYPPQTHNSTTHYPAAHPIPPKVIPSKARDLLNSLASRSETSLSYP